jgi:hypothetical protein
VVTIAAVLVARTMNRFGKVDPIIEKAGLHAD